MGAELVGLALAHWTHVSDRAFRVLVRMSLTALDKPNRGRPAAVYLGGRELLAMTLRSDKGSPETRYRIVKRALAELSEAGAIQHLKPGWAGQNAVYRLTLDRAGMGGRTSPPVGGQIGPPMGGRSGTEWGVPQTPPRNQEELQEEPTEEPGVDLRTAGHRPREPGADVIQLFPDKTKRPARSPLKDRLAAILADKEAK
jgi:hypothetical protein